MLVKLIVVIDQATGAEPSFRSVRPAIGEDEYFGAKEIGKWRAETGARISLRGAKDSTNSASETAKGLAKLPECRAILGGPEIPCRDRPCGGYLHRSRPRFP